MSRLNRTILLIGVSALLVLVLSACTMEIQTWVNEDGSGEFVISFIMIEDDLLALIDQGYGYGSVFNPETDTPLEFLLDNFQYGSVDDLCEEMSSEFDLEGLNLDMEAIESGGGFECRGTIRFASIEELERILLEMEFEDISIIMDDEGNFSYQVIADSYEAGFAEAMYYEEYGFEVAYFWKVTVPGKITSTNGSKSGNTVTWDLLEMTKQGGMIVMEVKSEKSSGGIDIGVTIGGDDPVRDPSSGGGDSGDSVGLIIILAIVVVLILASSQKKKPESED